MTIYGPNQDWPTMLNIALTHTEPKQISASSPHYAPYPKLPCLTSGPHFLLVLPDSASPCVRCGNKGHHVPDCSAKFSSRPECPIIIVVGAQLTRDN